MTLINSLAGFVAAFILFPAAFSQGHSTQPEEAGFLVICGNKDAEITKQCNDIGVSMRDWWFNSRKDNHDRLRIRVDLQPAGGYQFAYVVMGIQKVEQASKYVYTFREVERTKGALVSQPSTSYDKLVDTLKELLQKALDLNQKPGSKS